VSHPYKTTGIIIILYLLKNQRAHDLTGFLKTFFVFLADGAVLIEAVRHPFPRTAVMLLIRMVMG
jgi:hypothetical protein